MFLPVTNFDWDFIGFQALLTGFLMITDFELFFFLSWMANFTYLSILLLRNKSLTIRITISVLTIIFSLLALVYFKFPFQELGLFNSYPGLGYIVWLLSFILMFYSLLKEIKKPQKLN
ncbi:MAG: hypothetical protein JXQ93_11480 [Flavobacteriaceae bacterium]